MIPKIRAWDTHEDVMNRVDYIDFANGVVGLSNENVKDYEQPIHRVKFMQYTGLKDKNGVEVYFNDIVEDEYGHRYEVVFEGDCLRCNGVRRIRGGHKPKNRWFGIDLKIIGNRYENPELLEELEE